MKHTLTLILSFLFLNVSTSQNTVGLLNNDREQSYPGYNLIYPHNQSNTYLLDNCGRIVHTWEGDTTSRPGNSAYILENGNLIKCQRRFDATVNDRIWAGGGGATVEVRTWENDLLSSYSLNNDTARLHHDIAALPNGNILMIAWALKDSLTAIAAGRNPALLQQGEVWSEMILEWNPNSDEIVWKWDAWNHLIQDFDAGQLNFGAIANHPELININYDEHDGHPDWLHINAIDYNPVLDQIVLSVPYFNELWIIDHSTTTTEAAGHTGGNSGKGGDLLYRWGNPAAYNQGTEANKKCFFQHDVHWVQPTATPDEANFGVLAFFNNRVGIDFATINSVQTSFDNNTQSYLQEDQVFQPADFLSTFIYPEREDIRAFSNSLSSAQFLPNGNILALSGRYGFAYELNSNQDIVWSYLVPIRAGSSVLQGDSIERNENVTFRMNRYPLDYSAFDSKGLEPTGYLELAPDSSFCGRLVSTNEIQVQEQDFQIYPNPTNQYLTIEVKKNQPQLIGIYDMRGVLVEEFLIQHQETIDIQFLPKGLYMVRGEKGLFQKLLVL